MAVLTQGPEKRYANALLAEAKSTKQLADITAIVAALQNVFATQPALVGYLASPQVAENEKLAAITALAKAAKAPELVMNWLALLAEKGRLALLQGALFQYVELANAEAGRVVATVATAVPLTAEQRTQLTKQAQKMAPKAKEIELDEVLTPSLIAGVQLTVDSKRVDASVRTRLNSLRQHMKSQQF